MYCVTIFVLLQDDDVFIHFLADVDRQVPRLQRGARVAECASGAALVKKMVKNNKDINRMATIRDGM